MIELEDKTMSKQNNTEWLDNNPYLKRVSALTWVWVDNDNKPNKPKSI